jgi:phosphoglycolate phosphatase
VKLVLFDCDGTIVDSGGLIHRTMVDTFVQHDLPPPDYAQTRGVIGLSLEIAIVSLLDPATGTKAAAMAADYKTNFLRRRSQIGEAEAMYDGMADLLNRLAARDDVMIGMVTGKSRRGVASVVATHGLERMFQVVRTADDCPSKPHPAMVLECIRETGADPDQTWVIGDAIFDMQMARAAGTTAIGVSWGYHQSDDLIASGAHGILSTPGDFLPLLTGEKAVA